MDTSGLPSLLREAALSAAVADGVLPPPSAPGKGSASENPDADLGDTERSNELQEQDETDDENKVALPSTQSVVQDPPPDQAAGEGGETSEIAKTDAAAATLGESQAQPNDGSTQVASSDTKASSAPLRRGKWSMEEEQYANRLIHEFKAGLLPLTDGTTLRTFLSRLLNCDPMRISKKFVGSNCIGKQVFRRRSADVHKLSPEELERTRLELCELERLFLDRLSQTSGGKGGVGRGGRSSGGDVSSSKNSRIASRLPSLGQGGGGVSNTNKSAAALGRAMLQGKKGEMGGLQSQNQSMFPTNPAMSFLSLASQPGSLGNINTNTSLTSLMLQSGMTRDQISMLAATGFTSSASLANLLRKQRSFDQHLNMDFQSMQSFEDLVSMIQGGIPNQASLPKAQMKNMDWGSQGIGATGPENMVNPGLMSYAGRQPSAFSSGFMNINKQMENTAYENLIQNAKTLQGSNAAAGGQAGTTTMNDFNSYIQSLATQTIQQQQIPAVNYGSLLQGIGGSLQNDGQDSHRNNSLLNLLNQSAASIGNTAQAQSFRPFNQNLQNESYAGTSQGNPMIMALAQQQLLAQAVGGYGQQSTFPGLARGMNNPLGHFGAALGTNWGVESSYGATSDASQMALFQQLLAQQQSSGQGGGVGSFEGLTQNGSSNLNALSGNKRISERDEDGGLAKKQQTASL